MKKKKKKKIITQLYAGFKQTDKQTRVKFFYPDVHLYPFSTTHIIYPHFSPLITHQCNISNTHLHHLTSQQQLRLSDITLISHYPPSYSIWESVLWRSFHSAPSPCGTFIKQGQSQSTSHSFHSKRRQIGLPVALMMC